MKHIYVALSMQILFWFTTRSPNYLKSQETKFSEPRQISSLKMQMDILFSNWSKLRLSKRQQFWVETISKFK